MPMSHPYGVLLRWCFIDRPYTLGQYKQIKPKEYMEIDAHLKPGQSISPNPPSLLRLLDHCVSDYSP